MVETTLFEEYRLIERIAINRAWKGAQMLLFSMAFIFGMFNSYCFHKLMYLFNKQCVLFPKFFSLTSMHHSVLYEYLPSKADEFDLPVEFLGTLWSDESTCSIPTYVSLVSGTFGLVWTVLSVMCSTESTITRLSQPWRMLPFIIIFSLAMGGICVYASILTYYGLQDLCHQLCKITGSSTCSYTVNVITLAYERRISGMYQATRLTIISAWLHTACWLSSALLAIARILLVVDFQLVRVRATLKARIKTIMEREDVKLKPTSRKKVWFHIMKKEPRRQ